MKRILSLMLAGAFFLLSTNAHAQFRKIPGVVTDSFKVKYPTATGVNWQDNVTNFQASFTMENEKYEAKYNSKGEWQGSQKKIKQEALPSAVKDGLTKSKYADWKVGTVTVKYLTDGKLQYGIFVSKGDLSRKNLLFSSDGQLLKDATTI